MTAIAPRSAPASPRVGDRERADACDELSAQFAAGRLTDDELEERLSAAVAARTRFDLQRLLADLPALSNSDRSAPAPTPSPAPPAAPLPIAPSWTALDVVALLVLIGCGCVAGIGVLFVLSMGDAALGASVTLATVVAALGGASAVHLAHRGSARQEARFRREMESGRR